MDSLDVQALPVGPLSMSTLLSLEPAGLRLVLRAGLRQGIQDGPLRQLIGESLAFPGHEEPTKPILEILEQRGWLVRQGELWKTRLG
jgi:hypothetical protein